MLIVKNIKNTIKYFIIILAISFSLSIQTLKAQEVAIKDIYFPTDISFEFSDTFGADRYNHFHEGTDIMGEQMAPLYAAVDGVVSYMVNPEGSWGYAITIKGSDDYTYHYLHINNDTPGTDDGNGGIKNAYAEGIERGVSVKRGQLIGYMGDSGNAESVGHHLHFEIRKPNNEPINPYNSLLAALNSEEYNPEIAKELSGTINDDKNIVSSSESLCESNTLIKMADYSTVYYCGADSKRYIFPNEKIFYSWYDDFSDVVILGVKEMEAIPLGGNVTYKPGSRMIKMQTSSKVYVVERGGTLRWVQSTSVAENMYGEKWNTYIDDLPDSLFFDYNIGEEIVST